MIFQIIPAEQEQVILGMTWLKAINPKIDWVKKTVQIQKDGQKHLLRVQREEQYQLISPKDVRRINHEEKEAQVFTIQTIEDSHEELRLEDDDEEQDQDYYDQAREEINDPDLKALLDEFSDVFRDELPKDVPPRIVEHRIELKEGAQPAAVAQYRLPPKFKQTIQETVE